MRLRIENPDWVQCGKCAGSAAARFGLTLNLEAGLGWLRRDAAGAIQGRGLCSA